MLGNILAVFYGLVFGIANIIPGVSGGTMLVVFGCYDKVCGALTLNLKEIKKNIVFLIFFGVGAVIGILGFAFVISWLFENCPVQTNLFFMGLILGSVPLILKNATVSEQFRPSCIAPFLIGLIAVVGLTILQSGAASDGLVVTLSADGAVVTIENRSDSAVESWSLEAEGDADFSDITVAGGGYTVEYRPGTVDKIKGLFGLSDASDGGELPNAIVPKEPRLLPGESASLTLSGGLLKEGGFEAVSRYAMSAGLFLKLLLATFVAAIAMIIPGVSGSFVMVTLGTYAPVIGAIKELDVITLLPVAVGAVAGIVLGARLVTFLMKRFRLMTFSVILGLVAGSVYAVFPVGFGLNFATLTGLVALAVGAALSLFVGKKTKIET
ncbi:MAG: DUF368 domain-containing protein [Bacteroides sp.]|nr:DUF368 domain-containing protein [Roseburia sp.]MCM1462428.1 DUF368 domain-containing protein [Bacteroides sp.]